MGKEINCVNTMFARQQKFVEEGIDAVTKVDRSATKDADLEEGGDAWQHIV
jgi:hypothetical protein